MNRLIIIGNGFDLAHGLKTSFKDFFFFYLRKVWRNLINGKYSDVLIRVESCTDYFRENDLSYSDETALKIFSGILKGNSYKANEPRFFIDSNLFKSIFTNAINSNWSDIEVEYFSELTHIIELSKRAKNTSDERHKIEINKESKIDALNDELDKLKELLIEYLTSREKWYKNEGISNNIFSDYFDEYIYQGEGSNTRNKPNDKLFLNFNYTDTLLKYTNNSNIIHIHGTLTDNPVFGFGDDTSEKYKQLENEYSSKALAKIKSFSYLKNNNYKKLICFLEKIDYQVHIYGHSCGVSDRTLFKKIFENIKCKHIKIFYHNEEDFVSKTYEISRHFDDKNKFLEKVVTFEKLRMMPQSE